MARTIRSRFPPGTRPPPVAPCDLPHDIHERRRRHFVSTAKKIDRLILAAAFRSKSHRRNTPDAQEKASQSPTGCGYFGIFRNYDRWITAKFCALTISLYLCPAARITDPDNGTGDRTPVFACCARLHADLRLASARHRSKAFFTYDIVVVESLLLVRILENLE